MSKCLIATICVLSMRRSPVGLAGNTIEKQATSALSTTAECRRCAAATTRSRRPVVPGCIAACAYHVDGPYPQNPQKPHIYAIRAQALSHVDGGKPCQGSGAAATTRRRHDPPPPLPPGAGHKVDGRDPMCLSGGLVWATSCAHITGALRTLKPAKDLHLRPLHPPYLDLHGGKPRPPRQARLPSPGGRLPVVPRQGWPCLKG